MAPGVGYPSAILFSSAQHGPQGYIGSNAARLRVGSNTGPPSPRSNFIKLGKSISIFLPSSSIGARTAISLAGESTFRRV